ncbi:hypothetical protein GOARA_033_00110 [Gordonia araii NBRC 100433]|uniref:Uncharacterized protein n=1 Tax=Gordonia araii NBRC 100433 TaxID=1073574 RepID=G7H035_9ACTN|nr:hypothetical protein [Gordonia araii]NNG99057.1 hypothetical protein [Gordonia araii NBRC 100433]GAB09210.1 hypothetical protein GOARA_033_00110 [Gordonia araii NBRC 100433]
MGVPRAYPVTGLGGEGVILERRHRLRRCGRWSDTANGQVGSVFIPEAGSENLDDGIAAQIWRFRPDLAAALGIAHESTDDPSASDPQDEVQAEWVDAEPVPDGVVHEAFGHIVVQVNGPREVTVSGQLLPLVHATGTRKNVSLTVDGHPVATYGARRGVVLTGYTSYLADTGENLLTLERNDAIRSSWVSLKRGRDFKRIGVVISRRRGWLELSIRDRSDVTPAELAAGVAIAMLIGTRSFSPLNILNGI